MLRFWTPEPTPGNESAARPAHVQLMPSARSLWDASLCGVLAHVDPVLFFPLPCA